MLRRKFHAFFFSIFNRSSSSYHVTGSTLVIKQKLPGIYVQPSYKSALSKDPHWRCMFHLYNNKMWLIIDCFLNPQHLLAKNGCKNKIKCNVLAVILKVAISEVLLITVICLPLFSVVWSHIHQTWLVPRWSLQIHCVYSR